jgi:hypothetical protein
MVIFAAEQVQPFTERSVAEQRPSRDHDTGRFTTRMRIDNVNGCGSSQAIEYAKCQWLLVASMQ